MGKIRTRFLGDEEVEKKQKSESKERAKIKKLESKSNTSPAPTGHPHVERALRLPEGGPEKKSKKHTKDFPSVSKTTKGKNYQNALKMIDKNKTYAIFDAIKLLKKMSYTSFDESVEIHMNILEKGARGEVALPHSTGRTITVVVADDALLESIAAGTIDFDVLIAHPSFMPKLARHAKVLGPKGLMPNPKAGTISTEPEKAAESFRKGTLHWKSESKFPLIHQTVAKFSLDSKAIGENIEAFIVSVGKKNIKELFISGSMTPSVKIAVE